MTKSTLSRKAQITQAAIGLFRNRGYAASSMRDLAREVGIEPASLYSHIRSKHELLAEICISTSTQLLDKMEQVRVMSGTADDRLREAITARLEVISKAPEAFPVFLNDAHFLEGEPARRFETESKTYLYHFRQVITAGQVQGQFNDMDVKMITETVLAATNWTWTWFVHNPETAPGQLAQHIYAILRSGILSPGATTLSNGKSKYVHGKIIA